MRNQARVVGLRPYSKITPAGDFAYYACHDGTGTSLSAKSGSVLGDQTVGGTTTDIWSNTGWLTFNSAGTHINDTSDEAIALGDLSSKSTGLLIACSLYISANPSASSEHIFSYGNTAATSNGWFAEIQSGGVAGKIRTRSITAGGDTGGGSTDTLTTGAINTYLGYFDVANGLIHAAINGGTLDSTECTSWPTADDTGRGLGLGTKITAASTYSQQLNSQSSGAQLQNVLILAPSTDVIADIQSMAEDVHLHPWELSRIFNGV